MGTTPYVILGNLWHRVDACDALHLVCGLDTPKESEDTRGRERAQICPGCSREFDPSSVLATYNVNMSLWRSAIAASVTEERREEVMRFHKLAIACARAAGVSEGIAAGIAEERARHAPRSAGQASKDDGTVTQVSRGTQAPGDDHLK